MTSAPSFEERLFSNLSPAKIIGLLVGLLALTILFIGFVYIILYPQGKDTTDRDFQRGKAIQLLTTALNNYYNINHTYPHTLQELVPSYIDALPVDPKTKQQYEYSRLDNGDYKICIYYETQKPERIGSYYYNPATKK